ENISGYGKFLHGEAISIGQIAAAELSASLLRWPKDEVGRIRNLFERTGLPTQMTFNEAQRKKLFAAMTLDKKVSGGEVKFVLAERIGKVVWNQRVPAELINGALDRIANRNSAT